MWDVVVIGAGALGLCTAHELLERGVDDVTVLDARHVAGASSGLSVGIIETQYLDPLAIEVRVWSMRAFAALERDRGLRDRPQRLPARGAHRSRPRDVRAQRRASSTSSA